MSFKEEVEKLAQSLKRSGLAASLSDAVRQAESILKGTNKGQKIAVEESAEEKAEKQKTKDSLAPSEDEEKEDVVRLEAEEETPPSEPSVPRQTSLR